MATMVFPAVLDTYIFSSQTNPNDSQEGAGSLVSRTVYGDILSQPILKFNCSSDTTSLDKIIAVNLTFECQSGSGVFHKFYPLNRAVGDNVTWPYYSGWQAWAVPGAFAVPQDRSGTALCQKAIAQGYQEVPIDKTAYVNWRGGSAALIVVPENSGDWTTRIYGTGNTSTSNWPKIVVEYIPPTRAMYILGG